MTTARAPSNARHQKQDPLGEVAWKQKLPDELGSNIIVSVVVKLHGYKF